MNGLIEDNEAAGWLEENPNSIAGHILKLKDDKGKPLNRARLIQVLLSSIQVVWPWLVQGRMYDMLNLHLLSKVGSGCPRLGTGHHVRMSSAYKSFFTHCSYEA